MDFLHYLCETYKISLWGTSLEYFRQYKQLYASATGRYKDRNVPLFGLRAPNANGKDVADSGDMLVLQTFNIAYNTSISPLERHRVQLSGCYLFLACTGARPAEIVDNEKSISKDGSYQELWGLQAIVVRHPETGKDVLAMAVKLIHHKGADGKPKPTIFFFTPTRRLIFCLITVIVSLAVSDEAFDTPSLTSEWLKRPIVRRFHGSVPSPEEALPYHKLRDGMGRPSLDAGCEKPIEPKAFRKGAANEVNDKLLDSADPDTGRSWNLSLLLAEGSHGIIMHMLLDPGQFLEDPLQYSFCRLRSFVSLLLEIEPALLRAFNSKRRTPLHYLIFPLPSKNDDATTLRALNASKEAIITSSGSRRREKLKAGQYRIKGRDNEQEIRELIKAIRTKQAQREKAVRRTYHAYYFYNRPTWEIERQARGEPEVEYAESVAELHIPERAQLAQLFYSQPGYLSDEKLAELRIESGELMTALRLKRETPKQQLHDGLVPSRGGPRERRPAIVVSCVDVDSACGEQLLHDGLVPSLGGPQERRPAIVVSCVDVDSACGEQLLHDGLVPSLGGIRERRPAIVVSCVDVDSACSEQLLHDGLVPSLGGIRERRPAIVVSCVDVDSACGEQLLYDGLAPSLGGKRERRPAILILYIDIDLACGEKLLHDGVVPSRGGIPERRPAIVVSCVDVDSACSEQLLHDGLVPSLGGIRERRPAIVVSCVDVDSACVQQPLHDGVVPSLGGIPERRPAIVVSCVDVDSACGEQLLHDGLVPSLGGPQERRPAIVVSCVDVDSACGEQLLHDGLVPSPGGPQERRPAIAVSCVDVDSACSEQLLHDGLVPSLGGIRERRLAITVLCIDVDSACGEQLLHDGLVPSRGGPRERRPAIVVSCVDVDSACGEQLLHDGLVPSLGGIRERRLAITVLCIDVDSACGEQLLHDGLVPSRGGPRERRPAIAVSCVDVSVHLGCPLQN
ncbi:hypothetical protein SBRCBS47491_004416 [Sporothrix bragantina]|uniref:Uncharacterized protein n=1 Tax=Sporothrix bragantina TaxID=671064 RepID=A0ABP0BNA1_9PEZI